MEVSLNSIHLNRTIPHNTAQVLVVQEVVIQAVVVEAATAETTKVPHMQLRINQEDMEAVAVVIPMEQEVVAVATVVHPVVVEEVIIPAVMVVDHHIINLLEVDLKIEDIRLEVEEEAVTVSFLLLFNIFISFFFFMFIRCTYLMFYLNEYSL